LTRRHPVIDSQGHDETPIRNGKAIECHHRNCGMVRLKGYPWSGPCRGVQPTSVPPAETPAMGVADEPTSPGLRRGVTKEGT
jgi:hypothetical protein